MLKSVCHRDMSPASAEHPGCCSIANDVAALPERTLTKQFPFLGGRIINETLDPMRSPIKPEVQLYGHLVAPDPIRIKHNFGNSKNT
jgi:hypothetical protein